MWLKLILFGDICGCEWDMDKTNLTTPPIHLWLSSWFLHLFIFPSHYKYYSHYVPFFQTWNMVHAHLFSFKHLNVLQEWREISISKKIKRLQTRLKHAQFRYSMAGPVPICMVIFYDTIWHHKGLKYIQITSFQCFDIKESGN